MTILFGSEYANSVRDVFDAIRARAQLTETGAYSCIMSIDEISKRSGYCRSTVKVGIRLLCALGCLQKHASTDQNGGNHKNRYDVLTN